MNVLHENLSCEVLLTNFCNINCDYCIAKKMPGPTMDKEIGRKAIDMFMYLAEGGKNIDFIFSGGEPLVAFSLLEEMIAYAYKSAKEAGIQANFILKTNGTILNQSIIDFLKMYFMKVVISIDGIAEVHDRHRQTKAGQGTHHAIHGNLLSLLQNKIPCVASITIHPDSCSIVAKNVEYLHSFGVDQIDIAPAYGTVTWTSADNSSLVKSLIDVAAYMRKVNNNGNLLEVIPLHRASEHVGGVLSDSWGCHAACTNLAFLPNGKIAGCSALAMLSSRFPELILGDVFDGLNQQAVDYLLHLAQAPCEQRVSCQKCKTASNCTGGCLAINYATNDCALAPPQFYCNTISIIPTAWNRAWADEMHCIENKK